MATKFRISDTKASWAKKLNALLAPSVLFREVPQTKAQWVRQLNRAVAQQIAAGKMFAGPVQFRLGDSDGAVLAKLINLANGVEAGGTPVPTLTISPIGGDNNITAAEAASITVAGTTSAANGASVFVTVAGNALGTATVASGAWSLTNRNLTAYADGTPKTVAASCLGANASVQLTVQLPVPVAPPALASASKLLVYDASIGNFLCNNITLGAESVQGSRYFAGVHGLTVKVINKSVAGQTLAQIAARWEAEKATYTGDAGVIVMSMPIGNSITGRWDAASDTTKNNLIAAYTAFANSVTANGNTWMPVNTTWRNSTPESLIDEANGSDPWNRNVIWPVALSTTPSMWYDGRPFMDWYEFMRRWFSMLADDRHPTTPQGVHMLRAFAFDGAAARIKGLTPPTVTRYTDPTPYQAKTVQRAMVLFSNLVGGMLKSSTVFWALTSGAGATGSMNLLQMDGYSPNALILTAAATVLTGGGDNANAFNTADYTKSLTNDGVKNTYMQTTSQTFVEAFRISGFAPGQSVKIDFLACRAGTGDTRRGWYSVDGGATYVEVSATYTAPAVPTVSTITGVADSSGVVIFSMRCKVGSTNAYLNGVIITPL